MINKILVRWTNLIQRGNGWLPILSNQPEGPEGRLWHVGWLPVYHLYGHDAQAPNVNLLAILLLIHNLNWTMLVIYKNGMKSCFVLQRFFMLFKILISKHITYQIPMEMFLFFTSQFAYFYLPIWPSILNAYLSSRALYLAIFLLTSGAIQ